MVCGPRAFEEELAGFVQVSPVPSVVGVTGEARDCTINLLRRSMAF